MVTKNMKKRLNEKSCNILLTYFDCVNLKVAMENKSLLPRIQDCLEDYRRLHVCEITNNKLIIINNIYKNI